MSDESESPKIIVDEDWKTQVERERTEVSENEAAAATDTPAGEVSPTEADNDVPPPPPASLTLLVTTLLTQAMVAMGQMPATEGAAPEVNLPYAKHFIDLVGVIEEKTKGNLTEEESKFLGESLHQTRMLYVSTEQQAAK